MRLLTGARQVGKTTLLKHLFPNHTFVSLDLPSTAELAENNPEEFTKKYPPPVVIDEVQYAPKIFRYLKLKIDEDRHSMGRYILTGSQKFILMKNISDSHTIFTLRMSPPTLNAMFDKFSMCKTSATLNVL